MLDDDFLGIDDRREIDRLVPLNEVRKVAHELLSLVLPDGQSNIHRRTNHEFVQFSLMFHVEQLRESADEVKTFRSGDVKISEFARLFYDETCCTSYLDWIRPCIFRALQGEEKLPLV